MASYLKKYFIQLIILKQNLNHAKCQPTTMISIYDLRLQRAGRNDDSGSYPSQELDGTRLHEYAVSFFLSWHGKERNTTFKELYLIFVNSSWFPSSKQILEKPQKQESF